MFAQASLLVACAYLGCAAALYSLRAPGQPKPCRGGAYWRPRAVVRLPVLHVSEQKDVPEHHKQYLAQAEENRRRAAERRLANSKKFWRKKVVYDFMRGKVREHQKEAVAATRWEKVVTRPLASLQRGMWLEGKVRNLERFGAWVDIGAERDGLLHISDLAEGFTARVQDVVTTGAVVKVVVKHVDAGTNKLALSMVPVPAQESDEPEELDALRTPLADMEEGDELWGEVTKVTNFGVFVEAGTEVLGFLHVSDWPAAERRHPLEVFSRGQRLRTYVKEVDIDGTRLKLTGIRPEYLPTVGGTKLATEADLGDQAA